MGRWTRLTARSIALAILLSACGAAQVRPAAEPVTDTDATSYRINAAQAGSTAERIAPPVTRQWRVELPDRETPPLVVDRRVFLTSWPGAGDSRLEARSLRTGKLLWSRTLRGAAHEIAAGPTAVYRLDQDGVLSAFRTSDGTTLWSRSVATDTAYSFTDAPTYAAGSLYLVGGGSEATAMRVDAGTGRKIWSTRVIGAGTIPTVRNGVVYLCFTGPQIYALRAKDGGGLWHRGGFPHGGGSSLVTATEDRVLVPGATALVLGPRGGLLDAFSSTSPVTVAGSTIVTLERGGVHAARLSDLRNRWLRRPAGADIQIESVVVTGNVVWTTDTGEHLRALDLATGRWLADMPLGHRGGVTAAGNRLVVADGDGVSVYGE